MKYPTIEEARQADISQVRAWWKGLPVPRTADERVVLTILKQRIADAPIGE